MKVHFLRKLVKKLVEKIYTFEEIKKIHYDAKGYRSTFDDSMGEWEFVLKTVNINEILTESIWDMSRLESMSNGVYHKEYQQIKQLILAIENGEKLPSVILGWKNAHTGKYDLRDGKHRLSAMNYLSIKDFEAFIRVR